jgi:DNA-directed RNA polymerase specialized sigma24 family protein
VSAPAGSIEDRIDASRAWRSCVQILQRHVTAPARRVFELRYLGCRSIEAVAGELDKSVEAVRVALMRTRRILCQRALDLTETGG